MKVVQVVLVVLHLLGVLALLVGLLVQVRNPEKRVTGPMRDGIGTTFVAGLLLVGVLEIRDEDVRPRAGRGHVRDRPGDPRPRDGQPAQAVDPGLALLAVLALTVGDVVVAYAL